METLTKQQALTIFTYLRGQFPWIHDPNGEYDGPGGADLVSELTDIGETLAGIVGLVQCCLCQEDCFEATAHPYQGQWIGDECCWEEHPLTQE